MRVACSGCRAHLSGDPADPVVSHGMCSRECWDFAASLSEFKAEILDPDPTVAAFAVRLPSESRPGVSYEVALLVTERESQDPDGHPIDVPSGLAWDCGCESFSFGAETCRHLVKALHLHTLQTRMKAYMAARARAAS